jgi:ketosteroid isomerase-like protein
VAADLDLVKSIYAAWGAGEFDASAWASPDIEFVMVDGPDPGRWKGLAAMAERWREWLGAWEDFRAEPEEYLILDGGRVLALVRNSGRGRASGLELEQRSVANLFEVRNGQVARLVIYFDRDRAVAELGPPSERAPANRPS